ncbi:thiolase family protein [Rhodosalinus halophilus]|uniref:Thiolase family protein n=1 Tax=Rhodosalinus halophilus TaxID=2259333 RepID=A0A365UD92_9RHOB|nr:thiolase family protein [Rhodosalinus halophilus]RBI87508.1 thiolase family protein [Rhodosalinus halophilus]
MPAFIPYKAYWSTPFARWQGSLAHLHALELARIAAERALARIGVDPAELDAGALGLTVPQHMSFYGFPWLAGTLGAERLAGPTITQACATGTRLLAHAAGEVAAGAGAVLTLATDRVSNGPHVYYPAPAGPGGTGKSEDWVLDNFGRDPFAKNSMLQTAENVAARLGIPTEEQHALVLRRYEQYADALADDRAFQKRYMELPFEAPAAAGRGKMVTLEGDEGVTPTSEEKLGKLKPVLEGGTVTFGGQTHPADGAAGAIVTSEARARELSADPEVKIELVSFGQAREEPGYMPAAPVPAARQALERAALSIGDIAAIKSHNPFVVNDIAFARSFNIDPYTQMNNYGCSLVWGHPQGPTALRGIIELIEELVLKGGGYGLFQGCAAGDTAMACVVRVG